MTLFMLVLGFVSPFDIVSYYEKVKIAYGIIINITSIMLLNMLVAIIGSHYFEYYLEQENVDANFFKIFLKSYLGDDQIEHPKETDSFWVKFM